MNHYADAREGIDLLELIQQIKTYFWVLLLAAALTGTAGSCSSYCGTTV